MRELALLFFAFAKIGCTLFGGGYAMLPLLLRDIVDKYGRATKQELVDCFAVKSVFYGPRAASCALVVSAWTSAVRLAFFSADTGAFMWQGILLASGLIAVKKFFKCHPSVLIAISAAVGIIFKFGT